MKTLTILILIASSLALSACNDSGEAISPRSATGTPAPKEVKTQLLGTSSGGGGFSDTYAQESLVVAKYALAKIIENTSSLAFKTFPEGKQKAWMVELIKNIEVVDVKESRYGRPLKFNYDLKNEKIYATRHYVESFPYGRFYTRSDKEKNRILSEVFIDILHELSHFYGVGVTEKSDVNSEYWATAFLKKNLDEVYVCAGSDRLLTIQASTGMTSISGRLEQVRLKDRFSDRVERINREASWLMPYFDYTNNGAEKFLWENLFFNYIVLANIDGADKLPPIYGQYDIQNHANHEMLFSGAQHFSESFGGYGVLGVPERTRDTVTFKDYKLNQKLSSVRLENDEFVTDYEYTKDSFSELVIKRYTPDTDIFIAELKRWSEIKEIDDHVEDSAKEELEKGGSPISDNFECKHIYKTLNFEKYLSDKPLSDPY